MGKKLLFTVILLLSITMAAAQTKYYTLSNADHSREALVAIEEREIGVQLRLFADDLPRVGAPYRVLVMTDQGLQEIGTLERNIFGIWELIQDFKSWRAEQIIVRQEETAVLSGNVQ
ncbi:MAG TPA: hypothetical protein VJK52_04960 [Candidatus Nanoarchaeia archaeon]|nr:hypothetical protein [Candidatus Nanoarchaeia archaeon]